MPAARTDKRSLSFVICVFVSGDPQGFATYLKPRSSRHTSANRHDPVLSTPYAQCGGQGTSRPLGRAQGASSSSAISRTVISTWLSSPHRPVYVSSCHTVSASSLTHSVKLPRCMSAALYSRQLHRRYLALAGFRCIPQDYQAHRLRYC
jgi:hypothetical protein